MKHNLFIKSIVVSVILSISVLAFARQEKVIRIFSNGEIISEYVSSGIDYIQIDDFIDSPENLSASASATAITISWGEVEGATYNIYRSANNVNFALLESGLRTTSYTDKSPLRGANYYRVTAIVEGKESGYTPAVAASLPENGLESGIYLGVYGFNQSLFEYPMQRLDESSLGGFNSFIDGLATKNGTILYYSVEQALNSLQTSPLPADVSNVALVTFTDGLDQGSMMKNDTYDDDIEYLESLNNRIMTQSVAGEKISAYSIGVRGSDVADITMFK